MRTILSVIELTNETENSQEMMYNTTTMGDVNTNYSEECGLMDDEYVLISSTVQVKVVFFQNSTLQLKFDTFLEEKFNKKQFLYLVVV